MVMDDKVVLKVENQTVIISTIWGFFFFAGMTSDVVSPSLADSVLSVYPAWLQRAQVLRTREKEMGLISSAVCLCLCHFTVIQL